MQFVAPSSIKPEDTPNVIYIHGNFSDTFQYGPEIWSKASICAHNQSENSATETEHSTSDIEAMGSQTSSNTLGRRTTVHVMCCTTKELSGIYLNFVESFQSFASQDAEVTHCCVVIREGENLIKAAELIAFVLKHRDDSLNGQVLLVPK